MYASSSSTSTWSGTRATKSSNCCCVMMLLVGLLGEQTMTTLVFSVIASIIASRS